jgi:uncharacterized membrane protein
MRSRLLCRVRALGPFTGIIAAAATGGALLGFGLRAGTPSRPFNGIATLVLGDQARGVWGYVSTITITGIVLHVVIMVGWSMLFVALAARRRGWQVPAIALGVAAAAWFVSREVVLRQVGAGMSSVLGTGQLVALHLVLAVSLVLGMRFARSDRAVAGP